MINLIKGMKFIKSEMNTGNYMEKINTSNSIKGKLDGKKSSHQFQLG